MLRRARRAVAGLAVLLGIWVAIGPGLAAAQDVPRAAPYCAPGQLPAFVLGFLELKAVVGAPMGDAVECEHTEAATGDAQQQTTTGLSFYRRSTNTPTFTNGREHWALTSAGALCWLGDSIGPPPSAQPCERAAVVATPANLPAGLIVRAIVADLPAYDRDDWRHWTDADRDCQDTRAEVLIAESLVPVTFRAGGGCVVDAGQWLDPYTGRTLTDAGDLDIDHLVALGNAHRSGAWEWDAGRRERFANELGNPDHLIAVSASANRSKGDRGPEEWRPPNTAYWCEYARDWIAVKVTWLLAATPAEAAALGDMLATCVDAHRVGF